MVHKRKKRGIGIGVFASFIGALLVASSYFYNSYRFDKYKFLDFDKIIFYTQNSIFHPKKDDYIVLIYSSNVNTSSGIIRYVSEHNKEDTILAIDLYQKRDNKQMLKNVIYITGSINDLLSFLRKFSIDHSPTVFRVTRNNKNIFKQDSSIKKLSEIGV